jgi:hypothetical protein
MCKRLCNARAGALQQQICTNQLLHVAAEHTLGVISTQLLARNSVVLMAKMPSLRRTWSHGCAPPGCTEHYGTLNFGVVRHHSRRTRF